MPTPKPLGLAFRPNLPLTLLIVLLSSVWIAGGASNGDALGQVVVRTVAVLVIMVSVLFGERPVLRDMMPVFALMVACVALALLQLVPLPPNIWQALPGRAMFVEAAAASGQPQPWRPLAIVPGAAANALFSLVVPVAVLALLAQLRGTERAWLPGIVLTMIAASMFVGLLQFSGVVFNNPLINDSVGQVGGTFANRNHFALFLAFGCLLAPIWAFSNRRRLDWRAPVSLAFLTLLALMIMASGSRAGLILGVVAFILGIAITQRDIRAALGRYPRWVFPAVIATFIAIVAIFILISVASDRAISINRLIAGDPAQDMRSRALPTVLSMIAYYFPAGAGFGSFDPAFRIHEPFELLKTTYFNHAHNDWLEIVLGGGLAGLLLLVVVVGWWGWASVRAWRSGSRGAQSRLGSAMLLLVMIASIFDYPARTPLVMAIMVIAAAWLASGQRDPAGRSAG